MGKNGSVIVLLFLSMIVLGQSNAFNYRKLVATMDPNGSQDSSVEAPKSNDSPNTSPSNVESKDLNDANTNKSSENSSDLELNQGKNQDGNESKTSAGQSCKGLPVCTDHEKTMIACVQDFVKGSNNLSLVVQNEKGVDLKVNITFGTSLNNDLPTFEMPAHGTKKVNITIPGDKSNKVILNAGNGDCELQISQPKTTLVNSPSESKDPKNTSNLIDVSNPADSPAKPKEVNNPVEGPTKPKEENSPSKDKKDDSPPMSKDVNDLPKSKDVDEPSKSKSKGVDDPSKSKGVDDPSKSKSKGVDDPSKSKEVNDPSESKDIVDTSKSNDIDDPSMSKEDNDPSKSKDPSKLKDTDDPSKSKEDNDTSKSKEDNDPSKSKDDNDQSKDDNDPSKSKDTGPPSNPRTNVDAPMSQNNFLDQLTFYSKQVTPIYGAYLAFLVALIIGGSWALCTFRKRRTGNGVPYQELEMGPTEPSNAVGVETAEGWDHDWNDDDWDEDEAIRSPGGGVQTKSISSNGLTSRATKKDSWDADWDD